MKLLPKILIACPTSETKDYCWLDWIRCIKNIDYPKDRMEIFVVDNSYTNSYKKYLETFGIKVYHVNPKFEQINPKNNKKEIHVKPLVETVCDSLNIIRGYAYKTGCDYIYMVESDVMSGRQTLRTLLSHKKKVINACYFHGDDINRNLLLHQIENVSERVSVTRLGFKATLKFMDGSVKKIQQCGIGCCLIHRSVFSQISFRYTDLSGNINNKMFPDTHFYEDLYLREIDAFIDTGIILDHNSQNWATNINL